MSRRLASLLAPLFVLNACGTPTPTPASIEHRPAEPRLEQAIAQMPDGYRLPIRRWGSDQDPGVVVLGLHGFNDYGRAFEPLAETLAATGITTYAVDQRGFGNTEQAGRWHGADRLQSDLHALTELLRERHPQARLVVIGESMGAAVALGAMARKPLDIDALVLIAPAVWSRDTMPWYQRAALAIAARTLPSLKLTGEGIRIYPSDNEPMLLAMGKDPLVIKATRVDALWGVTNLMDQAATWPHTRRAAVHPPILILYGERDAIIPPRAFCRFIEPVTLDDRMRLVLYEDGWHMLPRDLRGAQVRNDIATWVQDPQAPITSNQEVQQETQRIDRFCRPFTDTATSANPLDAAHAQSSQDAGPLRPR